MPLAKLAPGTTLLLGLALLGCGDDASGGSGVVPSPDGGSVDVAPPDLGSPDLGLPDLGPRDAGPPPDLGVAHNAGSCAPCTGGCPGTSLCLTAQTGEAFCADRCDSDLEGCVSGFTCLNIAGAGQPAAFFCVPPNATCRDGVGYGTPCFEDTSACLSTLDHCEGDAFAAGYCTSSGCAGDQDCPPGYICGTGDDGNAACLSTRLTAAETCGRIDGQTGCATDHECAWTNGERCVRSTSALPGICASDCSAASCAAGTTCRSTPQGQRCLPDNCACHASPVPEGTRDLLAEALAAQDLTRCDTVATLADFAPNPPDLLYDPYRLEFFERVAREPLRAPGYGRALVAELDAHAAASVSAPARAARLVESLSARLDQPVERTNPVPLDDAEPLVRALERLIQAGGGVADTASIRADADDLSMSLRRALARAVEGLTRGAAARDAAVPAGARLDLFALGPAFVLNTTAGSTLDPTSPVVRDLLNEGIDYPRLFGGAVDLLTALAESGLPEQRTTGTGTVAQPATLLFSQPTPFGRIVVGGGGPDLYVPTRPGLEGDIALLVDLGGDDVYRVAAGGNRSVNNSVSVLVDLAGDDFYGYEELGSFLDGDRLPSDASGRYRSFRPPSEDFGPISLSDAARQGGGRVGTALVWDLGSGQDHYRSLRMSQGSGLYGTGVLIDEGGDDLYEMEALGQGAGAFGIGLLLDLGGHDVRRAYHEVQGFGYARGAGLAYDVSGDDQWLLNVGDPDFGGDPLYFSAQRAGRSNSSLGQGFGFGRRADFTDRQFFSGGLGLLVDASGSDRYEASIFAQGGGFWFGTGILADHEGDDGYDALWYAMGTGAHYALGLLLEGGGQDAYGGAFPRINVTMAGAHDYTTAFLIDDAGDDIYFGSRISLGAGNVNGLGFFIDNGGMDQYALTRAYGLGGAGNLENDAPGSARRKVKNLGVFIDAGGLDSYTLDGMPFMGRGDDMMWIDSQNDDPGVAASELGTGIDGEGESSLRAR
ncbi:MAG: hypothetical protein AAFZ18_23165 [Myxococcota bacterium]